MKRLLLSWKMIENIRASLFPLDIPFLNKKINRGIQTITDLNTGDKIIRKVHKVALGIDYFDLISLTLLVDNDIIVIEESLIYTKKFERDFGVNYLINNKQVSVTELKEYLLNYQEPKPRVSIQKTTNILQRRNNRINNRYSISSINT